MLATSGRPDGSLDDGVVEPKADGWRTQVALDGVWLRVGSSGVLLRLPMLVVQAARLFDGEQMVDPPVLGIADGRIVDVGAAVPVEAGVVDLPDTTLLPGLIDCHQHLIFDGQGTLEQQVADIGDEQMLVRAREAARRALRGGVTTLRDLGDRGFVTLALRDDATLPTILSAGPPITSPGGHCWYLGGECAGDGELHRAVDERVAYGCDVVKVMVSGGYHTDSVPMWASQFTTDELRLIVERAHAAGLPVAAHCHGNGAIGQAIDVGVDSIEHCTFFSSRGRCEPPDALVRRLAASGVPISATVGRLPAFPIPPIVAENLPTVRHVLGQLHELGAPIVAGTDAGISPAKPHDVAPHAMADFVRTGMTAIESLRALTSVAARVLTIEDRKGRLAAGFDADVVAVHGDPRADPLALTSVVAVWRAGDRVIGE